MLVLNAVDRFVQDVEDVVLVNLPDEIEEVETEEFLHCTIDRIHSQNVTSVVVNMSAISAIDAHTVNTINDFIGTLRVLGVRSAVAGILPQCALAMAEMQLSFGTGTITRLSIDDAVSALRRSHE